LKEDKENNNRAIAIKFHLEDYLKLRKSERQALTKEYTKRRCKGFKWNK